MLLRGLRLEGDCFPSDKNHLAPSEEPASQRRTEQRSTSQRGAAPLSGTASVYTGRRGGQATHGSEAISGLRYLTATLIGFIFCFQKEEG